LLVEEETKVGAMTAISKALMALEPRTTPGIDTK
jgi:hypothetical protein